MKTDTPLQRGKACLCCRKRKMKCDGTRPVCSQCMKANREAECQYHDKKQISRTQLLQQKVAKLEARLRELESEQSDSSAGSSPSPSFSSSSSDVGLHDPPLGVLVGSPSATPDWESNLFDETAFPELSTPFFDSLISGSSSSDIGSFSGLLDTPANFQGGSPLPNVSYPYGHGNAIAGPSSSSANWWENASTLCHNKLTLLDIFFAHRHQCAFDVHVERFQASLSLAPQDQPHPALVDAVYLMGCYFSRSPNYTPLESHFLKRALAGISEALQENDRVINVLQASCLLALYFFGRGRILEGYYHSSIAARLAVSLGLHQIKPDSWFQLQLASLAGPPQDATSLTKSSVQLAPPKDAIESEERITAFWQVFMVDRAWSVATGLPAALPDDDHPQAQIETVWPAPPDDSISSGGGTLPRFDPVNPYPTLRAKAVALFERTFRMASASVKGNLYWAEHRGLDMSLFQFAASLPPMGLTACLGIIPLDELDLLTVHTLIHVSTIHLHRDLSDSTPSSYEKCVVAANTTCWSTVADVFLRALSSTAPSLVAQSTVDFVNQELDLIVNAMKMLSTFFPIAGIHATKIEQDRTMTHNTLGFS
ncbi:unnamed protein product [Somion occarium]|uniref:Zn(2)-C6 fungal-type domain-containing protein n=1 Tax=Somion occarium TaxID=3059160 RepID=A0ABP1D621_9APHY